MEKGIGYTERTIALDAVIRHQQLIIESLEAELSEDRNGIYRKAHWLFKAKTEPTGAGWHLALMISQFKRGLSSLQEQLPDLTAKDIDGHPN